MQHLPVPLRVENPFDKHETTAGKTGQRELFDQRDVERSGFVELAQHLSTHDILWHYHASAAVEALLHGVGDGRFTRCGSCLE
ncbi:hypothetical protein ACIBCN_35995 [Nocardia sp. NPDC051052]|uniref:hypothetical protein n=1 Tax=Nocardia sp. NPDC051052 TaxID=3364322 RepID=UPI0037A26284